MGNVVVLVVAGVNVALRLYGGAVASLAPWGVVLSAVVAAGLAVTGWADGELSYRHLIGVDPADEVHHRRRDAVE